MIRPRIHKLTKLYSLAICVVVFFCQPSVFSASSSPADSVHFCELFDYEQWLRENPPPAGKQAAERNVGPPRTVRMFYFLPNDRPFRQEVVDTMKTTIRRLQRFFAEQMQAHSYGEMTFRYETDAQGDPLVHRVDGEHANSDYYDDTVGPVLHEIQRVYLPHGTIQFVVVDNSADGNVGLDGRRIGGAGGVAGPPKKSGYAMVPDGFGYDTATHELTHAFGLSWHDFRDNTYVLSYGSERQRLSACSAGFLAVNPFFNSDVPLDASTGPTIERVSPARYPAGSSSVSIRLKASDVDGVHQLILQAATTDISATAGSWEVLACRVFSGKKEEIAEFDYDGVVPSSAYTSLSDPPSHYFRVIAIDTDGNDRKPFNEIHFGIAEDSPYLITTLEGRSSHVSSVAFSQDGTILAAGSADSTVVLWDVHTREQIAVLEGHTARVWTVTFSPDGSILAAGSQDGTIVFWDVVTRKVILPVERHSNYVTEVAFLPDGKTLAAVGLGDDTVKLWDVATREEIGTLQMPTDLVSSMAFSPDGKTLAATSEGAILLWDVATLGEIATLRHSKHVNALAFSPDGATLAASVPGESAIVLWDMATHREISTIQGDWNWANSMAFSPDGSTLASGTAGGTVVMHNVVTEELEQAFPHAAGGVTSVDFSPGGATLAASSTDGRVELWDTSEWLRARPFRLVEISGDSQQGAPGAALVRPFVVEVRDQYGDPLHGVPVTFTVTLGSGTLGGKYTIERPITNNSGRVEVFLTLGPSHGRNTVEVSLGGRVLAIFEANGVGNTVSTGETDLWRWHLPPRAIARLGKGTIGGSDHALDFSEDGRFLALAGQLGVWIYGTAESRILALLPTGSAARSVSFRPDGMTLASGLSSNSIALWEVESGTRIGTLQGRGLSLRQVAFSPDGVTIAAGSSDGTVHLWDTATRDAIALLKGHTSGVRTLSFSPGGAMLASGASDNTIKLWDVSNRKEITTLQGHGDAVRSIEFSPDGRILASGSEDRTARLWDVENKVSIATLKAGREVSLAFSPDGRTLTTGSWRTMVHWDVATHSRIATLDAHRSWISSLAYSPDGTILISSSHDGTVMLQYVETGGAFLLPGFIDFRSMAISPDGMTIAVGAGDGRILQWDLATRAELSVLESSESIGPVYSLAISPDGASLASSAAYDGDATIKLWDMATQQETTTLQPKQGNINSMTFSPDGSIIASGMSGSSIKLLDVSTMDLLASLDGHAREIRGVAFSPDGELLVSASFDNTVKLWDVSTREEIATLTGHTNAVSTAVFLRDGGALASGSYDNSVKLWDVVARKEIATLRHDQGVYSVAVSPDGTVLAAGSFPEIILWDLVTRREIATLNGHTSNVVSLLFSPDGTTLISGSWDGTMLVWDMLPYITPPVPDPDFDGNGAVGFSDFVQLAAKFGLTRRDVGYEVRYDLDRNGTIGFSDFLIFAGAFGMNSGS